jgi:Mor family transcriptional regulator
MRSSQRLRAPLDDLAEELAIGAAQRLGCVSDDIRRVVDAVVRYLAEEYATQDLYIPAAPRVLPVDEIREALAAGESVRSLCRRYRTDRRTIYRALDAPARATS